ncbi:MAG: L-asparaginase, partial [Clostridia bacterium]|nr:L-asparaginase [Clostridia bacterium]
KEIALCCASHSGQEDHQQTTLGILSKLELGEENLHCGIMQPYNIDENARLKAEGKQPTKLHCSCSGKHSGMLALAKFRGYTLENYDEKEHPVQKEILEVIAEFADVDIDSIPLGVDGCGVPIYLLPIDKIALSYARLVDFAQQEDHKYYSACRTIVEAMNEYPEMVAGDYEFDTELMQAAKPKLIGKVGCEAVYCLGLMEKKLGICIKIMDGNERAVYPVVIQLLTDLGVLNNEEYEKLKSWHKYAIKNNLQETIGEVVPVFQLQSAASGELLLGKTLKV